MVTPRWAAFGRIGYIGLLVGNVDLVPGTRLGTAHLHETEGLRGAAMRRAYRWLERPDGDFTKGGNHVVRDVDEAATWLFSAEVLQRFAQSTRRKP